MMSNYPDGVNTNCEHLSGRGLSNPCIIDMGEHSCTGCDTHCEYNIYGNKKCILNEFNCINCNDCNE